MLKRLARSVVPSFLRQRIQAWRLHRALAKFQPRTVRHRYGDGELTVALTDPLAEAWYDHDWELPAEISLLRRARLRPGRRVFDLGAHQGVMALMLAREVGPEGFVLAVEANAHNAAAARTNSQLNEVSWITVLHAAAADMEGTLSFNESLNSQASATSSYGGTVLVPARTVDNLATEFGRPDILFVDVEGYECHVLKGAPQTLATRPDCHVEVHVGAGLEKSGGSVPEVLAHFPREYYDCYVTSESATRPVALPDAPASLLAQRFFLTALNRERLDGSQPA